MTAPTGDPDEVARQRVQEAAVAAAALYAASKATPSPVESIKQTMVSAAAMTTSVAGSAVAAILRLWRRTDPYSEASVARFADEAGRVLIAAQRSTASIASAAQLAQLRALGVDEKVAVTLPDQVRGSDVEFGERVRVSAPATVVVEYRDRTPDQPAPEPEPEAARERADRSDPEARREPAEPPREESGEVIAREVRTAEAEPRKLMRRAVVTYRYERSTGADHETANTAAERRVRVMVNTNVMLAQRLAEQQTLVRVAQRVRTVDLDVEIIGYRRVFHPELSQTGSCGLCIAASDRIYKLAELKPIHDECKCTVAPVIRRTGPDGDEVVDDPGQRITGEDLGKLYADAGTTSGRTKGNNLKRTRYVIEEHAELGPVLTRVSPDPVRTAKPTEKRRDRTAAPRRTASAPRRPAPSPAREVSAPA